MGSVKSKPSKTRNPLRFSFKKKSSDKYSPTLTNDVLGPEDLAAPGPEPNGMEIMNLPGHLINMPSTSCYENPLDSINFTAKDYSGIASFNSKHKMQNRGGKHNTLIGMQYVTHVHDAKANHVEKFELAFRAIQATFSRIYDLESGHYDGFRPSWIPEKILNFDDCIVEVQIESEHNWLGRPAEIEVVDLGELLNADGNPLPKRLKLKGSAGFGKSTICSVLTRQWSAGSSGFASNFELTIRYNLRDLPSVFNTIEEELIRFVHGLCQVEGDLNQTKKTMNHFSENILVILDGYDEAPTEQRKLIDMFVSSRGQRPVFGQSTVLVTTADLDGDSVEEFDRVARIVALGSSIAKYRHFIDLYFERDGCKASSLMAKLDTKGDIFMVGVSGFLLSIICHLHSLNRLPKLKSEFDIFEAMATYLLEKINATNIEALLVKTGQFFYQLFKEGRTCFTTDEMIDVLGEDQFRFVVASELIREKRSLRNETGGVKEYEAFHQLFATYFATKFLKFKYEGLRSMEDRTRFLRQFARQKDFHLSVVDMNEDKTGLLFHSEFHGSVVFRWNVEPRADVTDIKGSVEMASDNRDVFIYQFPSVIAVLENGGLYQGFKHANQFYPPDMPGVKAVSLLAENLTLTQFPIYFYHEYCRQTEGDLLTIRGNCVENGKVLWKGNIFCYRRLPVEKLALINVWPTDRSSPIRNVTFKRFVVKFKFSEFGKEESSWMRHFVQDYLQCRDTRLSFDNSSLTSGEFVWELIESLRKSLLYSHWRILIQANAGHFLSFPTEKPIVNCLVCPELLVITRARGELINLSIPYEHLLLMREQVTKKLVFEYHNMLLILVGMESPETEDDLSEDD